MGLGEMSCRITIMRNFGQSLDHYKEKIKRLIKQVASQVEVVSRVPVFVRMP